MIKNIVKRNGQIEAFVPNKVNGWGEWAAKTLGSYVDWASAVLHASTTLPETCTSEDLQKALIDYCISRDTWEYQRMAGRLYSALLSKTLYGAKKPTIKELHQRLYAVGLMKKMNFSDDDYAMAEKFIVHGRDLKMTHYQIQQLRKKYAIQNRAAKLEYESPQFVYMRMAMALAEDEGVNRMEIVKDFYDEFSLYRINPPTPNFTNLGTNLNGYASCFPAGTIVDANHTSIEIQDVKPGDTVLTRSGKTAVVTGTTHRQYVGKLYNFDTSVGFGETWSTADHRFVVRRKDSVESDWVRADGVRAGDFLYIPFPAKHDAPLSAWDVCGDALAAIDISVRDDRIGRINTCDNPGEFSEKIKTIDNIVVKNNLDFYRLLGYYAGNGHLTFTDTDNRTTFGLTFNHKDSAYIEDARNIITGLFGLHVTEQLDAEKDSCVRLSTSSMILGRLVDAIMGHGAGSKGDKIGFISSSDKASIQEFLIGYMRTDGCACKTGYVANSISRDLIKLVRVCALMLGYPASVSVLPGDRPGKRYPNGKTSYAVRVTMQPDSGLAVAIGKNKHKILSRGNRGAKKYVEFADNGAYVKVRGVGEKEFSGVVYDFEVAGEHSFTVDGVCVHNCCLYTTDDAWPSLAAGDHIAYAMTAMSAGIGSHIKTRSIGDPIRGGSILHQGKIPYYRAADAAKAANLQNGRGGAMTTFYTGYDPEVKVIQALRNPMTPASKQVKGIDYNFGFNSVLAEAVRDDKPISLFSVYWEPELYAAQYSKNPEDFRQLYADYCARKPDAEQVPARELAVGAVTQSFETGRHYLHNFEEMNRHTPFKEPIFSSNLCVSPETMVLTDNGPIRIDTLSGRTVNVWNGNEWSEVVVRKTSDAARLIRVVLDDGRTLTATEDHKWYLHNGDEVRCRALRVGDKLIKFDFPVIDGVDVLHKAYANGYYSGDGCLVGGHQQRLYFYGKKRELIQFFPDMKGVCTEEKQNRVYGWYDDLEEKFFVPDSNYTIRSRMEWLSGLLDADGGNTVIGNTVTVAITSNNPEFLSRVQQMLECSGIHSRVRPVRAAGYRTMPDGRGGSKEYKCDATFRLTINSWNLNILRGMPGFAPRRLFVGVSVPNRDARRHVRVERIEDEGRIDATYCFTEKKRNMAVFNGILTGQCAEIAEPTKAYASVAQLYERWNESHGEIALCSLGGVIVSNIANDEQYAKTAYYTLKMITYCIHKSHYVFPSLEDTAKARMNAGVGILGLAHLMAKKNLKFDTLEGRNFAHELAETHYWHLVKASLRISKEIGVAPWMHKTLWPEGWTPLSTYNRNVDSLVTVGNKRDWEGLSAEIVANGGIAHSVLAAHMPGESCLASDTEVVLADGSSMTLMDFLVATGVDVGSLLDGYNSVEGGQWLKLPKPIMVKTRFGAKPVTMVWYNGYTNYATIELEDGRVIRATYHHKFRVVRPDGTECWKMVTQLSEGDDIVEV